VIHRVTQAFTHLTARVDEAERAFARNVLPRRAFTLWESLPVADRRHGLDVARRLMGLGVDDNELIAAALLHDAAKGHGMRLWYRASGVLLEALAPRLLAHLASPEASSWRYPFHLHLHHAAMSADAALTAGCTSRVAAFIRGRPATEPDARLLAYLRAADEAS
jgi:hypothetical protein